ncbi:MAG: hypothetical protein GY780_04440 [bacterium]|nr:hypothetical protein [bacterium]
MAVITVWMVSGCSSEIPSEVGLNLVDSEIDVVLEILSFEDIETYRGKNISEADLPLADQEVLYLGSQQGNTSSILLNYDFSEVFTDSFPEERWTADNITYVKLRFLMLEYYGNLQTPETEANKALTKAYDVFELDEPFNPSDFPGDNFNPGAIHVDQIDGPTDAEFLEINLQEIFLHNWVEAAEVQGLVVSEGQDSTPGLSGFSSMEMLHAGSTLIDYDAQTLVAPVIKIHFAHNDSIYLLEPTADTSTFHEVSDVPADAADGLMMRTCLRTSPIIRFDLASLPENIFINRAILSVTNDTTTSFGNLQSVVVSEIGSEYYGVHGDTMPLADLDGATYNITGMSSLDPTYNTKLQFNVTSAVQRIVNDVYEGERGFILTAGEDIFPNYNISTVDPDFFFSQFNFFGTSAADTLKPVLKITYSSVDELAGGGK